MDVLAKIERGEIDISVCLPGGWSIKDDEQRIKRIDEMIAVKAEFLRLARLGAATEKAIENTRGYVTDKICKIIPLEIHDLHCNICDWQDFCKLRSEKGAG